MQTKKIIKVLGGPVSVANHLGVSSQAVSQWEQIPVDHVLKLAEASSWRMTPHAMRPDIYPNPADALPLCRLLPSCED